MSALLHGLDLHWCAVASQSHESGCDYQGNLPKEIRTTE